MNLSTKVAVLNKPFQGDNKSDTLTRQGNEQAMTHQQTFKAQKTPR